MVDIHYRFSNLTNVEIGTLITPKWTKKNIKYKWQRNKINKETFTSALLRDMQ